jgi:putative endonuclease
VPTADERRAALADGEAAERFVADALRADGWQVLAHRWVGAGGELDLVVERDRCLRIVEVKLRRADDPVGLEAITGRKLDRIHRAAEAWLQDRVDPYDEVCLLIAYVERGALGWTVQWYDDPE